MKSQTLKITSAALAVTLTVGIAAYFTTTQTPETGDTVTMRDTKAKAKKKNQPLPQRIVAAKGGKCVAAPTSQLPEKEVEDDAEELTAAQQAILDDLEEALDADSLPRVAKIVNDIQDMYRKGGDAAVPPSMREEAVDAISWFLPESLPELSGFMADSNPEVLEEVMDNFSSGISDVNLSDREKSSIFKQVAPIIANEDVVETILSEIESDMRNSVAVDTYKDLFASGSESIKAKIVESMQDFTGEEDITTPEQLDAWLKENPDDDDDEEFYS